MAPPDSPKPPSDAGDDQDAPGGQPKHGRDAGNPLALVGAGLEIAGAVGVLALLGWWLDQYFGTEPWLLVTGACLGLIGGLYNLIKSSQNFL